MEKLKQNITQWFHALPSKIKKNVLQSFRGENHIIVFQLSIPDSRETLEFAIHIKDDTFKVTDGKPVEPSSLTIECDVESLWQLIMGEETGEKLVTKGNLKIYGNAPLLVKLQALFEE